MKWRVMFLLAVLCSCRGRADELEAVTGMAGSTNEPEAPATEPEQAGSPPDSPDRDPAHWPVVEPIYHEGRRACPETHPVAELGSYYDPDTGCRGGGIAFCWARKSPPNFMTAGTEMVDSAGTCWGFTVMPLFFPRGWRDPLRGECLPTNTEAGVCPLP